MVRRLRQLCWQRLQRSFSLLALSSLLPSGASAFATASAAAAYSAAARVTNEFFSHF
jgi:hypothetical protein